MCQSTVFLGHHGSNVKHDKCKSVSAWTVCVWSDTHVMLVGRELADPALQWDFEKIMEKKVGARSEPSWHPLSQLVLDEKSSWSNHILFTLHSEWSLTARKGVYGLKWNILGIFITLPLGKPSFKTLPEAQRTQGIDSFNLSYLSS